jgi:pimeloyl-ACP methyl ester carboxylesterase
MDKIEAVEKQIESLSPEELAVFRQWFLEFDAADPARRERNLAPSSSGLTAVASGSGRDVVLVHGALGDYRQWNKIADELRQSYRVVAISRRGHWPNAASETNSSFTYESNRDDLLGFLRSTGRPVHLVGHSYGAGVVLLAALHEPQLVRSLILVEPGFASLLPEAAPGLEDELASRAAVGMEVQSLIQSGQHGRAVEILIDWAQGGPGGFAKLPSAVRHIFLSNAETIGPTFAAATTNVTCDDLRGLCVPTLVLSAEHTRVFYRLITDALASCVPQAVVGQIANAGHMSIFEQPNQSATLWSAFLREH